MRSLFAPIGPVHKEQILAAIKAGKTGVLRKPLTPTADEAKAIIDAEVACTANVCCSWVLCAVSTRGTTSLKRLWIAVNWGGNIAHPLRIATPPCQKATPGDGD